MGTIAGSPAVPAIPHGVDVFVPESLEHRNRLTVAFRPILALPHILLVGAPASLAATMGWYADGFRLEWGAIGAFGVVACVIALIGWFAIVFGASYPKGLWDLSAIYLRWRVRAGAYLGLLRDEYPPFGEDSYPVALLIPDPPEQRNRLTVAFRPVLAIPHLVVVWFLALAWGVTTVIAWVSILFTGTYPETLFRFGSRVLRWSTRVEAYLLLLNDDYPPFSLD